MARIPTRTPDECRQLADRQAAGEDLGYSDDFVRDWRSPAPAPKVVAPQAPAPKVVAPQAPAPKAPPAEAVPKKAAPTPAAAGVESPGAAAGTSSS